MAADPNSEQLIARYLLGELPEEQQVEIEDRAFRDREYLASITAVENDLIDEYVRQELSEGERRQFESRFLASAERRNRVEFARAFSHVASEAVVAEAPSISATPVTRISWRDSLAAFLQGLTPAARFSLAAATLLLLIGGAWLITETLRLRGQLTRLQAENQSHENDRRALERQVEAARKRNEELAARLNQEKQQREQSDESLQRLGEAGNPENQLPKPVIASLTLLPGISRGGGEKPKLALRENVSLVHLQIGIDPEEDYKRFGVELRTAGGRHVWTRDKLTVLSRRGGRAIGLTLPASVLNSGEYELRLKGITESGGSEDIGFYYFEVTKR